VALKTQRKSLDIGRDRAMMETTSEAKE